MYYLLREKLIFIAGLGLLFLYSCTSIPEPPNMESIGLNDLFSPRSSTITYCDMEDSTKIVRYFLSRLEISNSVENMVLDSRAIYMGMGSSFEEGFELVIEGDFNKGTMGLGLFLSFSWKKVKSEAGDYWLHRDGIKLSLDHYGKLIISTWDIEDLITRVNGYRIIKPEESIYLSITDLDEERLKGLTNGFIKTGIDGVDVSLDKVEGEYRFICRLFTPTESKASALRRLLNLFLSITERTTSSLEVSEIIDQMDVHTEDNAVIMDNVSINEKIIIDFINNVIFIRGEADK